MKIFWKYPVGVHTKFKQRFTLCLPLEVNIELPSASWLLQHRNSPIFSFALLFFFHLSFSEALILPDVLDFHVTGSPHTPKHDLSVLVTCVLSSTFLPFLQSRLTDLTIFLPFYFIWNEYSWRALSITEKNYTIPHTVCFAEWKAKHGVWNLGLKK